jgi:hypothetical protein
MRHELQKAGRKREGRGGDGMEGREGGKEGGREGGREGGGDWAPKPQPW